MIQVPEHPDYSKNRDRCKADQQPCVICGKPISTWKFAIHLHNGGADAVTEEEAAQLPDNADLGFYPIGANCLRQHPELKPYAHDMREALP